jgi:hemerythrin
MPFMKWNPDLEIGIREVDEQHKMLVNMINELHDSILDGSDQEKMNDTLTGLLFYAETHFESEENLFDKYGYPEANKHIKEHNDFIMKITDNFEKLKKGNLVLSVDIAKFLKDWLSNHVMIKDKKFKTFLKNKV